MFWTEWSRRKKYGLGALGALLLCFVGCPGCVPSGSKDVKYTKDDVIDLIKIDRVQQNQIRAIEDDGRL